MLEGGLIESFGSEAKQKILLRRRSGYSHDEVGMEEVVEKFVKYFKSILHHNSWYFGYFVACEFLNFFFLWLQIHLTNTFLHYKFLWYGWQVLDFYSSSAEDRASEGFAYNNPMCAVFPTEVSCTVPSVGAAGGEAFSNGLCILTQVCRKWDRNIRRSLYFVLAKCQVGLLHHILIAGRLVRPLPALQEQQPLFLPGVHQRAR